VYCRTNTNQILGFRLSFTPLANLAKKLRRTINSEPSTPGHPTKPKDTYTTTPTAISSTLAKIVALAPCSSPSMTCYESRFLGSPSPSQAKPYAAAIMMRIQMEQIPTSESCKLFMDFSRRQFVKAIATDGLVVLASRKCSGLSHPTCGVVSKVRSMRASACAVLPPTD
jgi:hypothetical protein